MSPFEVLDLAPIGNGTGPLAGRCKLVMPSGVTYECRIYRNKDGSGFAVGIAAAKNPNTQRWEPIVSFSSPELAKTWATLALEAITPHLAALSRPATHKQHEEVAHGCPF